MMGVTEEIGDILQSLPRELRELGVNVHIKVDIKLQVRLREEELHIDLSELLDKLREQLEALLNIDEDPQEKNPHREEAQPPDPLREATLEAIHMVYGPIIQREVRET